MLIIWYEAIAKVFGGRNATRGEIPHQVSLRRVDRRNKRLILTDH